MAGKKVPNRKATGFLPVEAENTKGKTRQQFTINLQSLLFLMLSAIFASNCFVDSSKINNLEQNCDLFGAQN